MIWGVPQALTTIDFGRMVPFESRESRDNGDSGHLNDI